MECEDWIICRSKIRGLLEELNKPGSKCGGICTVDILGPNLSRGSPVEGSQPETFPSTDAA